MAQNPLPKIYPLYLLFWSMLFLWPACSKGADDLFTTLQHRGDFSTFIELSRVTKLEEVLEHGGPYTIFAPTDEAFSQLPDGMIQDLRKPANRELLTKILRSHYVRGKWSIREMKQGMLITASGAKVEVLKDDLAFLYGGGKVSQEVVASNGLLHAIDRVVVPASLSVAHPIKPTTSGRSKKQEVSMQKK
jgi:uncharacterized surface protein with fasciclin (FAS1) repeats